MLKTFHTAPIAALALILAACGQGADDGTATGDDAAAAATAETADSDAEAPADGIVLGGEGITVGSETLFFNAGRAEVDSAVSAQLGEATDSGVNEECGAGPTRITSYAGGLSLNYQDDKLVGWYFEPRDGEAAASVPIAGPGGVTQGSSAAEVDAALDVENFDESTLGDEFYSDQAIGGFFEGEGDARILRSLFAGTNCFFR